MDDRSLRPALSALPLGSWRFYPSLGSTNDAAREWIEQGAPDLALVIADEQTRGRGRQGRIWLTPAGQALAVSLILYPAQKRLWTHYSALAALSLRDALLNTWHIDTRLKWPNDVLLEGKKIAGVLVETAWMGEKPLSIIIGMGLNVSAGAVPPNAALEFPAASLEDAIQPPPRREDVLRAWLHAFLRRRRMLGSARFLADWQDALAWRGDCVRVQNASETITGTLAGLTPQGLLTIQRQDGHLETFAHLDGHLRPCNL